MTPTRVLASRLHTLVCNPLARTVGAVAVAAATLGLYAAPASAAAVAPEDQGWWSEAQQAPSPAPTVPINQATGSNLMIGNDPSGANAMAAVRYNVPGTIDGEPVDASTASGTLTLQVAANGTVGTPVVEACPIISSWQSAQGGEWASRPKYTCATSAKGAFSADATAVTFKLTPNLQARPGVFDLAIVPDPANQTPFSVQFTAPGQSSLTVQASSGGATGDDSAAAGSSTNDAGAGDLSSAGVPGDFSGAAPGLSVAPDGTPLPADTATTAAGAGASSGAPTQTVVLATPARGFSDKRGQRAMGFVLLVLLGLSLWWFGGQPVRKPRLLGSLGPSEGSDEQEPVVVDSGGIGRFARPRSQRPPRL